MRSIVRVGFSVIIAAEVAEEQCDRIRLAESCVTISLVNMLQFAI